MRLRSRSPRRALVTALLAGLALALSLVACGDDDGDDAPDPGTTEAQDVGLRTVVLGDSLISGGGAGDYVDVTCFRSERSWPRQVAELLAEDAEDEDEAAATTTIGGDEPFRIRIVEDRSCGGATIDQLLAPWPERDQPAQIPEEPDPDVDLVLLGIGGNDVMLPGFALICATGDCAFDEADPQAREAAEARFEAVGARLVQEVHPAIRRAYPQARIVQVGYLNGVVPRQGEPVDCPWLEPDEQVSLRGAADALDSVLQQAVAVTNQLTGAGTATTTTAAADPAAPTTTPSPSTTAPTTAAEPVVYLDVSDAIAGHELCSEDPWLHPLGTAEVGHPTPEGHEAIAEAAAEALPALLG